MTSILTYVRNAGVPSEARTDAPVASWLRLIRPDGTIRHYNVTELEGITVRIRTRRAQNLSEDGGPGAA